MSQIDDSYVAGQLMPLDPDWDWVAGEFVYISAGEFMMGSDNGYHDEKPVHKVIMSHSFEMGRCQVTQEQWQAVMDSNPSGFKGKNLPVENVNWLDVQEFIGKLNTKSNKYFYSLPTEVQWEYACRAGTTGDYAGDLDAMAWYNKYPPPKSDGKWEPFDPPKCSEVSTHPVGQKEPNAWGLYDMHGNVWEWCTDWTANYSSRVVRGGSWWGYADYCRSSARTGFEPDYRLDFVGFRLMRVLK